MDRPGHEEVRFFVGTEVEHTPAFGKRTLFVVGIQPIEDILAWANHAEVSAEHIYFGANQSFPQWDMDAEEWQPWITMITDCLNEGILCTLDIDVCQAEGLVNAQLCKFNNFIPMISVKLPHIQALGYNTTIKLDDKDFAATNPGVWCHSLHSLQTRSLFTDWSKYTQDATI